MKDQTNKKMLSMKKALRPVAEEQLDASVGGGNIWGCCARQGAPGAYQIVAERGWCSFFQCEE